MSAALSIFVSDCVLPMKATSQAIATELNIFFVHVFFFEPKLNSTYIASYSSKNLKIIMRFNMVDTL